MSKDPKSVEEQLLLLRKRGMKFRNEEVSIQLLNNISYYRLKGYWWEMQTDKTNHTFAADSYFEDAIEIYNFDRHMKLLLFDAIERIEIALRTKLIYHMSLQYGPEWYLNPDLFQSSYHHARFVEKIKADISDSSEEFIKKHKVNHPGEVPESWKALEVITLGTLSRLFKNIKHQLPEKAQIAKDFGLNNQAYLSSWLLSITLVRNIIAHHSRLWNRTIINQYEWPNAFPHPMLRYKPDADRRRKIFPLLCGMLYMNDRIGADHRLKERLFELSTTFPNVQLYKAGFPPDWLSEPIFQS